MPNLVVATFVKTRMIIQDVDNEQIADLGRQWYVQTVSGTPTYADVVAELGAALAAAYTGLLSDHCDVLGCMARQVSPVVLDNWTVSTWDKVPGTGGATRLPDQVAYLISLKSDSIGKKYMGREYVPFPPTEANDDGSVETTYLTDLQALGAILSSPYSLSVGGRTATLNPVAKAGGAFSSLAVLTHYEAHNQFATQRRRGAFGRFNVPPI